MRQRETLIARIRHLRRVAAAADTRPAVSNPKPAPISDADPVSDVEPARVDALEVRIAHLERLLEGLQDSVHRESLRQRKRITELEARIEPSALGAALSKDARDRGL